MKQVVAPKGLATSPAQPRWFCLTFFSQDTESVAKALFDIINYQLTQLT